MIICGLYVFFWNRLSNKQSINRIQNQENLTEELENNSVEMKNCLCWICLKWFLKKSALEKSAPEKSAQEKCARGKKRIRKKSAVGKKTQIQLC